MNKGLVMSAMFLALSNNASTSLVETTKATSTLRSSCLQSRSVLDSNTIKYVTAITASRSVIEQETKNWHKKYADIDNSLTPEVFFDKTSMKQLKEADLYVRASEEMLRIQVESLMDEHQNNISERTLVAIRQLRVSIAKLRMTITNVLNIEKQLRPAIAVNKASFDMSSSALQSLKSATESVYFH